MSDPPTENPAPASAKGSVQTPRPLFNLRALVLLLLSESPGTGAGLLRRAGAIDAPKPASLYRVVARLVAEDLVRLSGTARRRGGGRRYGLSETGREAAMTYRRQLAVAVSLFPAEATSDGAPRRNTR